jgi:hypothetical protein
VFGRTKGTPAEGAHEVATEVPAKVDGKGRPTPKRREVEQANRRPIVGAGAAPRAGATKEERKAARAARREFAQKERQLSRQALLTGDEKHLPPRDRGPAKRYARDVVDARHNVGEYFLYVALVTVVLSFVRPTALISIVLLYGVMIAVILDSVFLWRRVQRGATEKFGAEEARGTGRYAVMRAVQLRRARLPRPMVNRPGWFRRKAT